VPTSGRSRYLSKTRYVRGLACRKWLWLAFNVPDMLPILHESTRYLLDEGRQIGELARRRYPTGRLLPPETPEENERHTKALLDTRVPLFEAGFRHPDGKCYARADVLSPVGEQEWNVIEVKSGATVHEEYIQDLAFQRYCYTESGLRVRRCCLLLINTKYERSGEIDPAELFLEHDVTDAVTQIAPSVQTKVEDLLELAHSKDCPEFNRGERYHKDEYGVHSDDAIWKEHPASDIGDLTGGGKKIFQLLEAGIFKIRDIPKSVVLSRKQSVQLAAHSTGQTHVNRKVITTFLEKLEYPLSFLDFETIYPAIPFFDGTRPYQQIPFQFSVHVVDAPGRRPNHHSFVSLKPTDPRKELLASLKKALGQVGHVIVWNQTFEKSRLDELALLAPEFAQWVRDVQARFTDLWVPFRDFAYYNPVQRGSASLKEVLPALTGRGYDGLAIADGSQASRAYLRAAFGIGDVRGTSLQEVGEIRGALERYCGQDTEGMTWIVEKLVELSKAWGPS
jgi:hypothetical protein